MLTAELQKTITKAAEDALKRRHEYLTLEHLLYALTEEQTGAEVLFNCGCDLKLLRQELEQFLSDAMEVVPATMEYTLSQTAAYERVLRRAIMQAHASGQTTIDSGNVIAAMFEERRSHAVYLDRKSVV